MTHIKFKNLTPDQPTNTLKIDSDVKNLSLAEVSTLVLRKQ